MKDSAALIAALTYIRRGWPVLPLKPSDKVPLGSLVPRGLYNASLRESEARRWLSQYREANVGIRTGQPSGLCVLDIDPKKRRCLFARCS